jgi:transposase InsO family protein
MARYKFIDTSSRLLAVDLGQQLLPGSFEHPLNYLIHHSDRGSQYRAHDYQKMLR